MRLIPLTKNQFVLVDDEDFDWLNQWKWYAWWNKNNQSYYAVRTELTRTRQYMHRQILGLEKGDKRQGDHIHHNTLDNRRSQLRIATPQQNQWNRKTAKGYCWHEQRGKYLSSIRLNSKNIYLGLFNTKQEARQAYLDAKEKYHKIVRKD